MDNKEEEEITSCFVVLELCSGVQSEVEVGNSQAQEEFWPILATSSGKAEGKGGKICREAVREAKIWTKSARSPQIFYYCSILTMMMPSTNPSSSRSCLLKTLLLLAALCGSSSAANNIGRIDSVADIEGVGVDADPNPTKKVFLSPSSSSAATPQDAPVIVDRRNRNLNRRKSNNFDSQVFTWVDIGSTKAAKAASVTLSAENKIRLHRLFDESQASSLTAYLTLSSSDSSGHQHHLEEIITQIGDYTEIVHSIIAQSDSASEVAVLYSKLGWLHLNLVDILSEGDTSSYVAKAREAFTRAQEIAQTQNLEHLITTTAFNLAVLNYRYAQDQAKAAAIAAETLDYVTKESGVVAAGAIAFQASCSQDEVSLLAGADACSRSFHMVPEDEEACSFPQVFACTLYELLFEDGGNQQSKVVLTFTYSVYTDGHIKPSVINEVEIQGHTGQDVFNTVGMRIIDAVALIGSRFPIAFEALSGLEDQSISGYNSDENKIRVAFSSSLDSSHYDDQSYALALIRSSSNSVAVVEPWAAFVIGMIAGWGYIFLSGLLLELEIDDAVDAIPVHFGNGMWGCIAVGFFARVRVTSRVGVGLFAESTLTAIRASPGLSDQAYTYGSTNSGWFYAWSPGWGSSPVVAEPGLVLRDAIPVVQAGVLGIYGLIVAVIIQGSIVAPQNGLSQYSLYTGFAHLAESLSGPAVGIVGDAGVRAVGQQEQEIFIGMILILIFAEALGLYGLIVALILSQEQVFLI
jgi:V-type H+-transporting ATPase proteolipid subunit